MAKRKRTLRDTLTAVVTGVDPTEPQSPEEQELKDFNRWAMALEHSHKFVEKWHKQINKSVERYLDDRKEAIDTPLPSHRLNLYHANITTLTSQLYARLPKVEADRRFLDPNDDVARVAGEMVTRILQNDMNDPDDSLNELLRSALQDRLLAGFGGARVRYCMEEAEGVKTDEWCDLIHTNPVDFRWSPCRTPSEVTWKAWRSYMTKDEVRARFGDEIATNIGYTSNGPKLNEDKARDSEVNEKQAEIWEVWDKTTKCVYWYSKGYPRFLDKKEDPLELEGFFPDARPMVANVTTKKYLPKPDFEIARDIYTEIDVLETRIATLTAACKVVGVYDAASKGVERMLTDGVENQLIPVDKWALFAEKGGVRGVVDWFPLDQVVNALNVLVQQQQIRIQQLYQVTGMSDIMRGQASASGTTATEQKIKAQFGSTRIQAIQDEFANFASDLLTKKVQLIQKFYDPARIVELSNIMATPDAQFVEQAIALVKDPRAFNCRIAVRPETMAQIDYDQIKAERSEYLQATAQFLGQSQGLIEIMPEAAPYLMQLMKFGLSGLRAGNEVEGVVDQFVAAMEKALAEKAAQPQPPDPEQVKAQAEMQKEQSRQQFEGQMKQMEIQAAAQEKQLDVQAAAQTEQAKAQTQVQVAEIEAQIAAEVEKEKIKAQAAVDVQLEQLRIAADMEKAQLDAATKAADRESRERIEFAKLAQADEHKKAELAAQQETERMRCEHESKLADKQAETARMTAEKEDKKPEKSGEESNAGLTAVGKGLEALAQNMGRPRTVKRDADGKVEGIE
jgi:hypothetical protein